MRDGTKTRERIETTALLLFVEKGVAGTTIRDIALAADVSEGALYRHYAGKDELVWTLFSRHYGAFAATLDELQAAAAGLRAKLDAMVAGFCRLFDSDRTLFRFLLLAQHGQVEKLTPAMANPVEIVRAAVASGVQRREIPLIDPDLATAIVMGIVLQTATFQIYGRLRGTMTARAAALSAACWRALTPDA
ncbi:MAG: Transcriptional regulator [Rhodospirillales bacterium]|jgi:AcrR family transcriptional regulator|nr:Transcriptional regulator [Rhodospirillales bacterium]